jgi:quercetin dioxygenase-like cupin family protein
MGDRTVHADPLTGQRFRALKTGDETGGQPLQTELWLASGGYIPAHVHPQQNERFELLSGQLRFTIGDQERVADVGDVIVVPAGTPQRASNESAEEAHLLIEVRPALDLQQALETLAALARSGRFTRRFIPRTPAALLQLSVVADGYRDTVCVTSPPLAAQRLLLPPLAALGRRLGYRKDAPPPHDARGRRPSSI